LIIIISNEQTHRYRRTYFVGFGSGEYFFSEKKEKRKKREKKKEKKTAKIC